MSKKVLLGMSGGIDSSVAAMTLLEQGFDVTGVTFLFSGGKNDFGSGAGAAKELALKIGIDHHTLDLRSEFNDLVISYFKESYIKGQTPFPCAVCNPKLKFAKLEEIANKFGCNYISTGHYVNIVDNQGYKYISEGCNPEKDQSFFLWGLENKLISRLIFPLGNLYKEQVKQYAAEKSFHSLTEKKESMGICFIKDMDYRQFLAENGVKAVPGHFIDSEGNILGIHKGIINYTIGQRRGLNLQVNKPLFVTDIRNATNEIVLDNYNKLYKNRIFLRNTKFIHPDRMNSNSIYTVKIRYRMQENKCRIMFHDKQNAVVELLEPLAMVAPGQTAVIYEDGRVLGGGFIESSE